MIRGLVGMALVALLTGPALAQGRRGFGMMGGISSLIGNESVQKELKLDDSQVAKAKELGERNGEKMREAFQDLQGLDQAERRAKMQEITEEMNASTLKAIGEFLKPEQITRLQQISYQAQGAMAFNDPEVAKKLNISDSLKSEIQEIVTESMAEMREIRQQNQDDREAMMKKMAEHRKETLGKVTAKLNDEQQKAWKELIGSPFEVTYPPPAN